MSNSEDLRKPILPGNGASDYERYLRTDELLALQKLPAQLSHKDEMTFQVVHQSSELLMKGAAFELERALGHIEGGLSAARTWSLITPCTCSTSWKLSLRTTITSFEPDSGTEAGWIHPAFSPCCTLGRGLGRHSIIRCKKPGSPSTIFTADMRSSLACMMLRSACWISTRKCTCSAFII